jgi:two-component system, OmpR family, response regulator
MEARLACANTRVIGQDMAPCAATTPPTIASPNPAPAAARVRASSPRGPARTAADPPTLATMRHRAGTEIPLSRKEFALLHELMRRPGEVLNRSHLIEHVWDFAYDGGSNAVDVYVRYLRQQVDRPFGRDTIRTVRGAGYRLDPDV